VAERGVDARLLQDRRLAPTVALALLVFALALAIGVGHWLEPTRAAGEPLFPLIKPSTTTTTTKPPPKYVVPPVTWLASPKGTITTFDAPGGHAIGQTGYYYGYSLTTPILQRTADWLQVRLPTRPNGSTAWVRASDVDVSASRYRIMIHRSLTKVFVYKDGFPYFVIPAGLGKSSTPTPLGSFFVAVIETPGPPGYGPIILDTSGHSEAISSWEGSGDAVIAMHGPISSSSDSQIGANGTYISNGCIRLHIADQQKLFEIPLGTPVDVVS
jgi:lipoprotein-anchoring transpeptidase ErfK/SrfK